ncbi:unnamed protein product, partial [Amoebophrya sp. A25]|eukprot:GSA25T00016423001.1
MPPDTVGTELDEVVVSVTDAPATTDSRATDSRTAEAIGAPKTPSATPKVGETLGASPSSPTKDTSGAVVSTTGSPVKLKDVDSSLICPPAGSEQAGGSEPSQRKAEPPPETKALYEIWPGQNKFFCYGMCVTAKETETFSFVEACCDLLSLCFPCCTFCNPDNWITVRDGPDPVRTFSSAHICAWFSLLMPMIFFCTFTYME